MIFAVLKQRLLQKIENAASFYWQIMAKCMRWQPS